MGDFNKVMILGRLTRDPEVRYTPSGAPVCDLGLAVNRVTGGGDSGRERREETTYVDVTLWNRQAELAGQYLAKGRELFVEGRLTMDTWDDKATGQKRSKLKIVCDNMQFIGGGGNAGGGAGGGNYQQRPAAQDNGYGAPAQQPSYAQPAPAQNSYQAPPPAQQPAQPAPMEPQFEPEEDDDIPF